MVNANENGFRQVNWAKPIPGQLYNMTAVTTGGGQVRLRFILDCNNQTKTGGTPYLNNGQFSIFVWPTKYCYSQLLAGSGTTLNQESSSSCTILKVETPQTTTSSNGIIAVNSTNTLPGSKSVIIIGEEKNSLASTRQVVSFGLTCLLLSVLIFLL
ncbi:predicted protein [Naegleria gruberi]|uniref:Predicted protein n=1 Tax=Naegleria gruberi TaxID=5762 RepID=D2W6N0_NAEGR|nr:uncharacterized protein NAEGRDRAFT_77074 [Naegleria gruberi]EFC35272.1 predicted protein [Naegleria gruberi]|eukprot:XP_002668016.1 predicted protein [Naegleria gruberi strain NEG-M]